MNPTPIKGEDGILLIYDTTASAYQPVACLTSFTIDQSRSIIESNTKCSPGVTVKLPGTLNYSVSFDGEFIQTTGASVPTENADKQSFDALLDLQNAGDNIFWKVATGAGDVEYFGEGILGNLALTQGSGDELSTFTGTLEGTGKVEKTDQAPAGT